MENFAKESISGIDPSFDLTQLDIGEAPQTIQRTPAKQILPTWGQASIDHNKTPSSDNENNFGGLCFDFGCSRWSSCSIIEDTGNVHQRGANSDAIEAHGVAKEEGLLFAGKMGLASGKVYFEKCGKDSMSGFYLETRFFVTTTHFLPQDRRSMELEGGNPVKISSSRFSKYPNDVTIRLAYLVFFDTMSDLAVFKLNRGEPNPPATLTLKDLYPAAEVEYERLAGKVIFSIGYNDEDTKGAYNSFAAGYFNALSPMKKATLQQLLLSQPPEFDDVFRPHERSLSIGRLAPEQTNNIIWYHSASGWYGISGSMIGIMEKAKRGSKNSLFQEIGLNGKVLGMFKGGEYAEEGNKLIVFSKRTIEMLQDVISV